MSWLDRSKGKLSNGEDFLTWLGTVPGSKDSRNGYDRLERLYKVNEQPGNYSYNDLERALDRGTGRSWRQSPGGQGFVNDWLARRQGAVGGGGGGGGGGGKSSNPLDIDPKRGTGEYDDIISSLSDELGAAQQTIADIQNRQVEQVNTPSVQDQLASVLAQMQIDFEARYSGLQDMMLQQSQQFQNSMQMMQQQSQAAQAAYQEQLRLSQNMAKAYVPAAEKTAETAAIGDQREIETRDVKNNSLSELSILSGLGISSNPLSGLQLA